MEKKTMIIRIRLEEDFERAIKQAKKKGYHLIGSVPFGFHVRLIFTK